MTEECCLESEVTNLKNNALVIARVLLLAVLLVHLACRATAQSDPQNTPANRVGYGGGAYRVGGGVSAPKALYAPDPEYSEEARKAKYQGTVVLWLVVDANGRPQQIRIQRALGMGLDEKAVEAVKMWKFEPARKDGQPVPVMINVEVNFRLWDTLFPHTDSASQPPRFPGVDTSKYPLVVRLNAVSFSGSGAASTEGYQAAITDAGQERQATISCIVASSHCLVLDNGTYPARWEENMKSLEILGLSSGDGKWEKTEYTAKTGTLSGTAPADAGALGGVTLDQSKDVPAMQGAQPVPIPEEISQGLLVNQVKPVYPAVARAARIQGAVVLTALIGKDGAVQELELVSGHPMLVPAAMEAVKQWRYRPYVLNGEPVLVQTTINVDFTLANN